MYSGKTVEINNTDAEGRLVLGNDIEFYFIWSFKLEKVKSYFFSP